MKKFSTAILLLSAATTTMATAGDVRNSCRFLPSAPDSHQVRRGDTLWDIAGRFLQDPWCWPQVWSLNRADIPNPHRIYPGQTIVFDRERQTLQLAGSDGRHDSEPGTTHWAPGIRSEALPDAAIPAINPLWLQAAARLRLLQPGALAPLPHIVAFAEQRRMAATGDIVMATGALEGGRQLAARTLPPVLDPDDGRTLAIPLQLAGELQLLHSDGLRHQFRVLNARQELVAGDVLAAATPAATIATIHAAPAFTGRIAAVLGGAQRASPPDIVALNRGRRAGLNPGSLVAVVRPVTIAADEHPPLSPADPQPVATLLVVDALEDVSLALVLRSRDAITVGDAVRSVADAP